MGQTVLAEVASGLALAGVLAVSGTAAGGFSRGMPHLGIGAIGASAAVLGARLGALPTPFALVAVAAAGAAAGALAWLVDRQARNVDAPVWSPVLLPDIAVLALGLSLAALLRPASAIDLPVGPLGGLASNTAAVIGCLVGVGAAFVVAGALIRRRPALAWILATAATAVAMAIGAGLIAVRSELLVPTFGTPDVVGLALRAAAVGVIARRGLVQAVVAALVLGVGEALLRSQLSLGEAAVLPAVAVLAWGLWQNRRAIPRAATA